jgi:hypothetical protein
MNSAMIPKGFCASPLAVSPNLFIYAARSPDFQHSEKLSVSNIEANPDESAMNLDQSYSSNLVE